AEEHANRGGGVGAGVLIKDARRVQLHHVTEEDGRGGVGGERDLPGRAGKDLPADQVDRQFG
ncbi:MAG: hypothetical protein EBW68_08140, partial [Actinobacteria bacterium]|nr:hypothetical protein [Actinomycetota bacterium]